MKRPKILRLILIAFLLAAGFALLAQQARDREALYQVSVLSGLMKGDYDGKIALRQIRRHGDFGIGTFDRLDGEAVELDGVFYQVSANGGVKRMDGSVKSPFAMATFFDADMKFPVAQVTDYRTLQQFIDSRMPTKNIPYAIRIEGKFSYVKTRSVPAQERPYPVLAEVVKNQSVFEFKDIEGTLVGFRMPDYMQDVNVAGYHMHFLSRDKTKGGHLLECALGAGIAKIDDIKEFVMILPQSADFNSLKLSSSTAEAEKSRKERINQFVTLYIKNE